MPDEAALCSSQRRTNDHLFLPRCAAREQEIGKIGAHDQHHDAHGTSKQDQRGPHFPAYLVCQEFQNRDKIVAIRVFLADSSAEHGSVCLRALYARSGLQASDD